MLDHKPERLDIVGYKGEPRKIMIVDDNRNNCLMLQNMLEPLGFKVIVAENGEVGVSKAIKTQPDLILMDLVMPIMNGYEATRILRADPSLKDIPIIAVSAGVLEADIEQSRTAGCNDFLKKPVQDKELFDLLELRLNLVWAYTEQPPGDPVSRKTASPLVQPPEAELIILHRLAQFGNMRDIQERAEYVATLGAQYVPFAEKLGSLAENFEEKAILQMMENYLESIKNNGTDPGN